MRYIKVFKISSYNQSSRLHIGQHFKYLQKLKKKTFAGQDSIFIWFIHNITGIVFSRKLKLVKPIAKPIARDCDNTVIIYCCPISPVLKYLQNKLIKLQKLKSSQY